MSKNGYKKPFASNSTLIPSPINQNSSNFISNSNLNQNNPSFSSFSNLENIEEDPYFFSPLSVNNRPGRIIHQSTEQSIDKKGNRVIKTKTIRELDSNSINVISKNKKIKIITKTRSQKNYQNINMKNNYRNNQYELKTHKLMNQTELYSSPNIIQSSLNYNEIISPLGYVNNNSSGSENEENHMKSFEAKNKYYLNKLGKIKKINYKLEDPENLDYLKKIGIKRINKGRNFSRKNKKNKKMKISRIILNKSEYYNNSKFINNSYQSELLDFQSPDRDITNQNKFRKITENMLHSKGPTNDDKKVTTSIKKSSAMQAISLPKRLRILKKITSYFTYKKSISFFKILYNIFAILSLCFIALISII